MSEAGLALMREDLRACLGLVQVLRRARFVHRDVGQIGIGNQSVRCDLRNDPEDERDKVARAVFAPIVVFPSVEHLTYVGNDPGFVCGWKLAMLSQGVGFP
jgi:hypothetical protein